MKTFKRMGLGTLLFLVALLPQLRAQQEIDPTWYDPWATASPQIARPAVLRVTRAKNPEKRKPVSYKRLELKKVMTKPRTQDAVRAQMQVNR